MAVNKKECNVYFFGVMDARWDDFVVAGIFLTNPCISDVFLSNQNFLSDYYILRYNIMFLH